MRVCSGIVGLGRQNPVLVAPYFLRCHARGPAGSGWLHATLGVLEFGLTTGRGILFVREVAIVATHSVSQGNELGLWYIVPSPPSSTFACGRGFRVYGVACNVTRYLDGRVFPGRRCNVLFVCSGIVLFEHLADVCLAKRDWDPIDASLNARPEVVCLKGILSTKLTCSLGDCRKISAWFTPQTHNPTHFQVVDCPSAPVFGAASSASF